MKNLIIIFDVDGTIMATKSGRTFPKDEDDYRVIWTPKIPTGAVTYIHTNQKNMKGYSKKVAAASALVGAKDTLIATGDDECRKPIPFGLIDMIAPDKDKKNDLIIYVGDAAGRNGDHSDTDLKLVLNLRHLGYNAWFLTPDDYDTVGAWTQKEMRKIFNSHEDWTITYPDLDAPQTGLFSEDDVPDDVTTIILCGMPGSGKSTICDDMPGDVTIIPYKSRKATLSKAIKTKGRICIDGTFPSAELRAEFISARRGKSMVIFVNTPPELARHNRKYREIIHGEKVIPNIAVSTFLSRFEMPSVDECDYLITRRARVDTTDVEYGLYYY